VNDKQNFYINLFSLMIYLLVSSHAYAYTPKAQQVTDNELHYTNAHYPGDAWG
jgi:hypothetical protein